MGDTGHGVPDFHLAALHHRNTDVFLTDIQVSHHDVADRAAAGQIVQTLQQHFVDLTLGNDRGTAVLSESGHAGQQSKHQATYGR